MTDPDRMRVLLLSGVAAALLAGGARAAINPGSASLPGEVIGVVGSGDKLSLKIKAGETSRLLNVGDTYQNGWKLKSLTDATATLEKDGLTQTIGLNPTGSVAAVAPDEDASTVNTLAAIRAERLALAQPAFNQLVADQLGPWDGKTPRLGLSLDETKRYVSYQTLGALHQPAEGETKGLPGVNGFLSMAQIDSLGAEADDYLAINQKLLVALDATRGVTAKISTVTPVGASTTAFSDRTGLQYSQHLMEANLSSTISPSIP
ncbi:MAG: hypothetical protein JWM33_2583 [Caulobacteraceae bacterium]|nr:hypothetical protein [Caulobacteraceae bacterium]